MPTIKQVIKYWFDYRETHETLPFANPAWEWDPEDYCWACGWAKGRHDRAHIVPRVPVSSSGVHGLDGPQNIVMLCRSCHKSQPQSADPQQTFNFMLNRPKGPAGLVATSPALSGLLVAWQTGQVETGCFCQVMSTEFRQFAAENDWDIACPIHERGMKAGPQWINLMLGQSVSA
jgi:hypothetical protein